MYNQLLKSKAFLFYETMLQVFHLYPFHIHNAYVIVTQLEDNLEREKKHRSDVEKAKRKLENDLKITQENVEELDRIKHDLEENVRR